MKVAHIRERERYVAGLQGQYQQRPVASTQLSSPCAICNPMRDPEPEMLS